MDYRTTQYDPPDPCGCRQAHRRYWPAPRLPRPGGCPACDARDLRNARETQEKLANDPVLAKLFRS